jgi:hypothetical protein
MVQWYHSHYSVQYGDGIWGPLIIKGPATKNYDIDLGAYPITDWFHASIFTVNAAALHARGPPTADNVLVNGSMTSSSGGKYAVTTLTPGKSHLLRIVNVGINNWVHLALDGHKFTVVSADFVPIVPYETDSLSIAVGKSEPSLFIICPTMSICMQFTHEYAMIYLWNITLTHNLAYRSALRCDHQRQRHNKQLLASRRHRWDMRWTQR